MRQRWVKFDWSIAIILSALLHGGLVWWMLHDQIETLGRLLAQGISKTEWALLQKHEDEGELGDINGQGTAIAPSDGDELAAGALADQDQPFLSRDPAGMGHVGDRPSPYTGPTGGGALASAMQQSVAASEANVSMRPPTPLQPAVDLKPPAKSPQRDEANASDDSAVAAKTGDRKSTNVDSKDRSSQNLNAVAANAPQRTALDSTAVAKGNTDRTAPDTKTTATDAPDRSPGDADKQAKSPANDSPDLPLPLVNPKPASPAATAVAMNMPAAQSSSTSQPPGAPMRSADPAPQADSEIDPFAQTASADFRAGKTIVRSGRKAKLTRPHIPLVGFWDGVALGRAAVTLQIVVDKTGNVVQADVLHSSGSREIDNPICQEAYNWWFEPNKNSAGEPVKTTFPFTVCVFR